MCTYEASVGKPDQKSISLSVEICMKARISLQWVFFSFSSLAFSERALCPLLRMLIISSLSQKKIHKHDMHSKILEL